MMFLVVVLIVLTAILLYVAYKILAELQSLKEIFRQWMCEGSRGDSMWETCSDVSSTMALASRPFAMWRSRGGSWELEHATVPPGYEPGAPPPQSGTFEGQRVKTECVKMVEVG